MRVSWTLPRAEYSLGSRANRPPGEPAAAGSSGCSCSRAFSNIEAIFDTLKDQLGLERHGAHTIQGVWIRAAQRLLALATSIWFNWQLGAPVKRSLVAYDH